MIVQFGASIPPVDAAIKISGGQGEEVRLVLSCHITNVNELMKLRGQALHVIMGTVTDSSIQKLKEAFDTNGGDPM